MEAPEPNSSAGNKTDTQAINLNYEMLQTLAKDIEHFYKLAPPEQMDAINILFKCLIERQLFYNIKEQLVLLPQWYKASRSAQQSAALFNAISMNDFTAIETFDPLTKSILLTTYTTIQKMLAHPQESYDSLPQFFKDIIPLILLYRQIDRLNITISNLIKLNLTTPTYSFDSLQQQYATAFTHKTIMSTTPRIIFPLHKLEEIYDNTRKKLLQLNTRYPPTLYKKLYDAATQMFETNKQNCYIKQKETKDFKYIIAAATIDTFQQCLARLPQECFTQEEIRSFKKEEYAESARQKEFLPESTQQQKRGTAKKQAKSKRRNRQNSRNQLSSELLSEPDSKEDTTAIDQLIQKYNNSLKQTNGRITEMNNTFAIIKTNAYLYHLYNLSDDYPHMSPTFLPVEPSYDDRIEKWHNDPKKHARSLNPQAKPEKIHEQIWRHLFPLTCLKYFSHFGKWEKWRDDDGTQRLTQVFFVEIVKGNLKKEGVFNIGYGIIDNKIYHTYFDEISYIEFLNKLSTNGIGESLKQFFKTYYQNTFPPLPSTTEHMH